MESIDKKLKDIEITEFEFNEQVLNLLTNYQNVIDNTWNILCVAKERLDECASLYTQYKKDKEKYILKYIITKDDVLTFIKEREIGTLE